MAGIGKGYLHLPTGVLGYQRWEWGFDGRRYSIPHPDTWVPGDAVTLCSMLINDGIIEHDLDSDSYRNMFNGRSVSGFMMQSDIDRALRFLIGFINEPPAREKITVRTPSSEKIEVVRNPALYEFNQDIGF